MKWRWVIKEKRVWVRQGTRKHNTDPTSPTVPTVPTVPTFRNWWFVTHHPQCLQRPHHITCSLLTCYIWENTVAGNVAGEINIGKLEKNQPVFSKMQQWLKLLHMAHVCHISTILTSQGSICSIQAFQIPLFHFPPWNRTFYPTWAVHISTDRSGSFGTVLVSNHPSDV